MGPRQASPLLPAATQLQASQQCDVAAREPLQEWVYMISMSICMPISISTGLDCTAQTNVSFAAYIFAKYGTRGGRFTRIRKGTK